MSVEDLSRLTDQVLALDDIRIRYVAVMLLVHADAGGAQRSIDAAIKAADETTAWLGRVSGSCSGGGDVL